MTRVSQVPWWKSVSYGTALSAAAFVLFAVAGELCARGLPWVLPSFNSSRFRQYDPILGISLMPNQHVAHRRGCFEGEVATNRWAMRDRSRTTENLDQHLRIALLGDSLVEGVHVKPDQVMNIRMEKLLERKGLRNAEVLNFGVAGIGTTQELLIYKERIRQFQPDAVVLLFCSNDVMNNSSVIQPQAYGIHTWHSPYYDLGPNGTLLFSPTQRRCCESGQSFLEAHSQFYYYLERSWARVNLPLHRWQGLPAPFGVFGEPPNTDWASAWLITEKVLTLLKDTVSRDGRQFVVLFPPDFCQIDPEWRERMQQEFGPVPSSFCQDCVEERLRQIAARNHIQFESLVPYFRSYRDRYHIQWPFFSYTCDTHYSPLGHQVAAEAIVNKLEEQGLLDARNRRRTMPSL